MPWHWLHGNLPRGQFKLVQPLRSPLGVQFEFSTEHSCHFYMRSPTRLPPWEDFSVTANFCWTCNNWYHHHYHHHHHHNVICRFCTILGNALITEVTGMELGHLKLSGSFEMCILFVTAWACYFKCILNGGLLYICSGWSHANSSWGAGSIAWSSCQTGYEGDYLNRGKWRKKDIMFMSHFSSVWCIWALEETS